MRVQVVGNALQGRKTKGMLQRVIAGFYPALLIVVGLLLLFHYLLGNSEAKAAQVSIKSRVLTVQSKACAAVLRDDNREDRGYEIIEDNGRKSTPPEPPRPRIEDMVELPLQEIKDVPPVKNDAPPPNVHDVPKNVWNWDTVIHRKNDPKHNVN